MVIARGAIGFSLLCFCYTGGLISFSSGVYSLSGSLSYLRLISVGFSFLRPLKPSIVLDLIVSLGSLILLAFNFNGLITLFFFSS